MRRGYKVRLYPTKSQAKLIDKTIGCCRLIYNAMLSERIEFYGQNKNNRDVLRAHKYKSPKEYKEEFPWLKEVSSWALNSSQRDLNQAYRNFYIRVAKGQKAVEYGTHVHKVDRFFPSSKLCSVCGNKKDDLKLSDRVYGCVCGFVMDRDLNAAINIKNEYLKSVKPTDNRHGEVVRPKRLVYQPKGAFVEVLMGALGGY